MYTKNVTVYVYAALQPPTLRGVIPEYKECLDSLKQLFVSFAEVVSLVKYSVMHVS